MIALTKLFDSVETNAIRHLAEQEEHWEEYIDPKSFLRVKRTYVNSKFILDKVADFTDIPVDRLKTPLICKYEVGDYFNWHNDIMLIGDENQHTCVVQLSAPDEYSGGGLEVDFGKNIHQADRNEGRAIVFPSSLQHRVTEITKGVRYALITWGTPVPREY